MAAAILITSAYQQWKQSKIDSTRIVLELDKELRTEEFRQIHELVLDGKIDLTKDPSYDYKLDRYLNYATIICKIRKDGVITEDHMHTYYDSLLEVFASNEYVRKHIRENKGPFLFLYERLQDVKGNP